MSRIKYGDLGRAAASLDQALYVASCFVDRGPQYVYGTTAPDLVAVPNGEAYQVLDESDPAREEIERDSRWGLAYRVDRPAKRAELERPRGALGVNLEPVAGLLV